MLALERSRHQEPYLSPFSMDPMMHDPFGSGNADPAYGSFYSPLTSTSHNFLDTQTFLLDESMYERLQELNPYSLQSLAKRLLEAHERGYWNPAEAILERLGEVIVNLKEEQEGKNQA